MSELEKTEGVTARFHGAGARSGPLTFAQRNVLRWVASEADEFSAVTHWGLSLPERPTLDGIAEAFEHLMIRYEALRTSFVPGPEPTQHVADAGELDIEVFEMTEDLEVGELIDLLELILRSQGVDYTSGVPLRVAVAARDGVPRCIVVIYSHMAVDFASMALIDREFAQLAAGATPEGWDRPVHQPIDQAEIECSDRGRRQSAAALRHWATHLRRAPQSLYPMPRSPEPSPGNETCVMRSPAAGAALANVVARTRAGGQVVVTAAMCAVLSQRTGIQDFAFASISGSRFRPRLKNYVGALAQDGLMAVKTDASTFDELVRQAGNATLSAITHSMFDANALWQIIDEIGHTRGTAFTRDFTVNNISAHLDAGQSCVVSGAVDETTTVQWSRAAHFPVVLMFNPTQLGPALAINVIADTRAISRHEVETLLLGVERLIIAAADEDVPLSRVGRITGIDPIVRGPEWVCVDSCWIELPQVRCLIADALGVRAERIAVSAGAKLTAYIPVTDAVQTPEHAHVLCMAQLTDRRTAMAPQHYVLYEGAPADPDDEASWRDLPVVAEGDGRGALLSVTA